MLFPCRRTPIARRKAAFFLAGKTMPDFTVLLIPLYHILRFFSNKLDKFLQFMQIFAHRVLYVFAQFVLPICARFVLSLLHDLFYPFCAVYFACLVYFVPFARPASPFPPRRSFTPGKKQRSRDTACLCTTPHTLRFLRCAKAKSPLPPNPIKKFFAPKSRQKNSGSVSAVFGIIDPLLFESHILRRIFYICRTEKASPAIRRGCNMPCFFCCSLSARIHL